MGANKKRRHGYWTDFSNVRSEIFDFINHLGHRGVMPTRKEITDAGRSDLDSAIQKHGGYSVVAALLDLKPAALARKNRNYWGDMENIKKEIFAFLEHNGQTGIMPTQEELRKAGQSSLVRAISLHGGVAKVAKQLGLRTSGRKQPGYWNLDNIHQELEAFIRNHGVAGVMPTYAELKVQGYGGLADAIKQQGGFPELASKFGFAPNHKTLGYWDDFENLEKELRGFVNRHGYGNVMPTFENLLQEGRSDLGNAIAKHGGYSIVAEKLGLDRPYAHAEKGYWQEFSNLGEEIVRFISGRNNPTVMPTYGDLEKEGRNDIIHAIQYHGGFSWVARKLGLEFIGFEKVSRSFGKRLDAIARCIQPLAETNCLSAAQVMIILRRAGLLDFRNHRIAKLTASLARGHHDEIEKAIADIVSLPDEENTSINENDDDGGLSESAVDALLDSEIENYHSDPYSQAESQISSFQPAPISSPMNLNTDREQAAIRGLSAIGQMHLPLDRILGMLTSKVFWNEFYKRLYTWYGTLDAAQTVTADDVDAAILAAYPEHTENEFVADASALFTKEVEQAVNLAATLSQFGWKGPRLRLHQADAARRMADILSQQDGDQTPQFILDADDPGMGKSASFLAAVAASGAKSIILIAPKTVADDTWASDDGEIRRCLPNAKIVRGIKQAAATPDTNYLTFYVLHYEELLNEEAVAALSQKSFDAMCADEIHYVKQRAGQDETRRRAAMETIRSSARAAIGLTGTPLVNELAEPMSLMQILSANSQEFDHSRLSSRRMSDVADVFEAMLPHVIRRRKSEVLLHLPGCDVRTVDIPITSTVLEEQMLSVHRLPKSQAGSKLVELRKLSVEAKLPYLLKRAEAADKLLILTYLTDDVSERIAEYLEDFMPGQIAHINGSVPKDERQAILDSFRAVGGKKVLAGTIGTIGVGLTLFDPKQEDTANQVIVADLPYTWAEFEQGIARLHREGQKRNVLVEVPLSTTGACLADGSAMRSLDEQIWDLINNKRELSDLAVDGKYDTTDPDKKVLKALRRWLKNVQEVGVEPLSVQRRPDQPSEAQRMRGEIGRLRGMTAGKADELFADPEYTQKFLDHNDASPAAQLSHKWLRVKLEQILASVGPEYTIVDMGCGRNPFSDMNSRCKLIGLDRHDLPGQTKGKMENPPLPDNSADALVYSLSLYGTAADLHSYFKQAARILRGDGRLFIVEPDSAFTPEGLVRFVDGMRGFGFELVGKVRDIPGDNGLLLKGLQFVRDGEIGNPPESLFERK